MVLPLSVDVAFARRPWANWGLVVATVVVFFSTTNLGFLDPDKPSPLILDGIGIGVLGHVLLHGDITHLLGNMVFLWVFGNAVCARIGSIGYLACYASFAATAAFTHLAVSDHPAIGASGAVNGVVGMFFVLYPKDYVTFGVALGVIRDLPTWVLVVLWLLLDLIGAFAGDVGVAHAAHIGGLLAGIFLSIVLLKRNLIDDGPSATLLDLKRGR